MPRGYYLVIARQNIVVDRCLSTTFIWEGEYFSGANARSPNDLVRITGYNATFTEGGITFNRGDLRIQMNATLAGFDVSIDVNVYLIKPYHTNSMFETREVS